MGIGARAERLSAEGRTHVAVGSLKSTESEFGVRQHRRNGGVDSVLTASDLGGDVEAGADNPLHAGTEEELPTDVGVDQLGNTGLIGFKLGGQGAEKR